MSLTEAEKRSNEAIAQMARDRERRGLQRLTEAKEALLHEASDTLQRASLGAFLIGFLTWPFVHNRKSD